MNPLISKTLAMALHEQIASERHNAAVYLYIAGCLRNRGLGNVAKHFMEQHSEEIGHSLEFFNLLTDLDTEVEILPTPDGKVGDSTIMEIAVAYLEREIATTSSIAEIKKLAISEDNPVVEEKMRAMIVKQQAEYDEATTFMDKATLMPEWWQWALYDASLG